MKHYVYVYLDPSKPLIESYGRLQFSHEPFYVGLGVGARMLFHLADAVYRRRAGTKLHTKHNKILKLLDAGSAPIMVKLYTGISRVSASRMERHLIAKIGRRDLGTGPLCNLTSGGDGAFGRVLTDEQRAALSARAVKMWANGVFNARDISGANNGFYGKKHSVQTIARIKASIGDRSGASNGNYGKSWSEEQRAEASVRQAANHAHLTGDANPAKRAEVREKLSAGKMGLANPNASRWQVTAPDGTVHIFDGGIHNALKRLGMTYMKMCYKRTDGLFESREGWQMHKV